MTDVESTAGPDRPSARRPLRRQFLAATVGLIAISGCTEGGDKDDEIQRSATAAERTTAPPEQTSTTNTPDESDPPVDVATHTGTLQEAGGLTIRFDLGRGTVSNAGSNTTATLWVEANRSSYTHHMTATLDGHPIDGNTLQSILGEGHLADPESDGKTLQIEGTASDRFTLDFTGIPPGTFTVRTTVPGSAATSSATVSVTTTNQSAVTSTQTPTGEPQEDWIVKGTALPADAALFHADFSVSTVATVRLEFEVVTDYPIDVITLPTSEVEAFEQEWQLDGVGIVDELTFLETMGASGTAELQPGEYRIMFENTDNFGAVPPENADDPEIEFVVKYV